MEPPQSQTTDRAFRATGYAAARAELGVAHEQAHAAWTRLKSTPDTLKSQIGWSTSRRHRGRGSGTSGRGGASIHPSRRLRPPRP
jgi:hypothetical protein